MSMLAIGVLGLLCAPQVDDTRALVTALFGNDARARSQAYHKLVRQRPEDALKLLVAEIDDAQTFAQGLAINVIQGYPREQSDEALRRLVRADAPFVQFAAALRLTHLGDKSLTKRLIRGFDDARGDEEALRTMAQRAARVDVPELHQRFRESLAPELEVATLDSILACLAHFRMREVLEDIDRLLASTKLGNAARAVCASCALALGETKHESHVIDSLTAKRPVAMHRMQKYLDLAPSIGDELLEEIAARLSREKNERHINAGIRLLAKHAKAKAARWIRPFVDHDKKGVAKTAIAKLVELRRIQPAELRKLLQGKRKDLVLVAADTLRRMDDHSGLERALQVARSGHDAPESIRVLAGFRDKAVVPALIDALEHENRQVRSLAQQGLMRNLRALYPFRKFDIKEAGYDAQGDAVSRAKAVKSIRSWWRVHG